MTEAQANALPLEVVAQPCGTHPGSAWRAQRRPGPPGHAN